MASKPKESASRGKGRGSILARRVARLNAVQALFQMEASGQALENAKSEFIERKFGPQLYEVEIHAPDKKFFRMLVETAVESQSRIDQMTDRALSSNWPLAAIDPTLRALFRSAGAELIEKVTPVPVAISEFVEIADAFFPDGKEPKFANAVLEQMAREARPEFFEESSPSN